MRSAFSCVNLAKCPTLVLGYSCPAAVSSVFNTEISKACSKTQQRPVETFFFFLPANVHAPTSPTASELHTTVLTHTAH